MTKIVVTVVKVLQDVPAGVTFAGTSVTVVDNAGNTLPAQILNGSETPTPWTAEFSGSIGSAEATATIQDLDTNGSPIGAPVLLTETGTGGQPVPQFPASTGGTIAVS